MKNTKTLTLNRGFVAIRDVELDKKCKYPNTFTFIIRVRKTKNGILQYIETECGNGEKLFKTIEESNNQIEMVRDCFIKDGYWKIENFYE